MLHLSLSLCKVVGFASDDLRRQKVPLSAADCYHSANRYPTGTLYKMSIVLPRSIVWIFDREPEERVLLGRECMHLQGHSVIDSAGATESQLQDMAGNALFDMIQIQ